MDWAKYLVLGFAPGLLWLWFVWSKDRYAPEPRGLVLRVFVLGGLTTSLILLVRPSLDELLPAEFELERLLLDAFLVTALCEELVKTGAMCAGVLFRREFDEPIDGIVYGAAAGLGFASVESVLYVAANDDLLLALERAFTASLLHLMCTGLSGLLIARLKLRRRWRDLGWGALGLVAAVALHGTYDALLLAGARTGQVAIALFLPIVLIVFALVLRAAARDSAARAATSTSG